MSIRSTISNSFETLWICANKDGEILKRRIISIELMSKNKQLSEKIAVSSIESSMKSEDLIFLDLLLKLMQFYYGMLSTKIPTENNSYTLIHIDSRRKTQPYTEEN